MRTYIFTSLIALCFTATTAAAQAIRVGHFRVRPQSTFGDTLSLSATPSSVNFTLVSKGIALGSSSVTITTTETGLSLNSSVTLYAYFATAANALSGSSPVTYIPSSAVLGRCPTGTPTAFTSFTSTGPFGGAGASLQVFSLSGGALSVGFSRSDVLSLEIDLSGVPQLPAATYTGSMFLQAQAF